MCLHADFSSCVRISQTELQVRWRKGIAGPFRPFDQAYSLAVEVVGQTCILKLMGIQESIEIKVVQV